MELVAKTGGSVAATPSAASPTTAVTDDGEFAALLAGLTGSSASRKLSEANAAQPAVKVAAAAISATAATDGDDDGDGDAGTPTSPTTAASTTASTAVPPGYGFAQADQYSPEVMSVPIATASGAVNQRSLSSATTEQLDLANAMMPLDPDIASADSVNDIPVIGPTSYSVIGYQPRASASDPLIPIYGAAPTSYS